MILEEMLVDADAFSARTGWEIKPEGACKGEVCVPLDRSGASTCSFVIGWRRGTPRRHAPLFSARAGGGRVR